MKHFHGIEETIPKTLKEKVINHRERFSQIFMARYLEMLPSLIAYKGIENLSVDFFKVEVALRNGYDVVIGETRLGNIQVIGYVTSQDTKTNPMQLWSQKVLTKSNINFIIDKKYQLDIYQEITDLDSCLTGNFVVLRNKSIRYVDDLVILKHYVDELAEIVLSRFSISMQVKIATLFKGEPNDETINEIISDVYNGNPYIKGTKLFDPDDQIYHMQNQGMAQNFQELKREYQNKISELNNMLGMNSLAVEKSSGVSDAEAQSNRAFTTSNANIYLDGRNNGLKRLNKRYGFKVEAIYNDEVLSEFSELARIEDDEGGEQANDNENI